MESLPPKPPPSSLPSSSTTWNSKSIIDSGERNWLDLPRDAVLSIFRKLDTIDLLVRAHNVCTTWRKISKDPFLFRTINLPNLGEPDYQLDLETLCHRAVDYSCGHITDVNIEYFGTNDLLHRIANSASHLQRLRLASCWSISDEGLCDAAEKFPRLEELDISISNLSVRLFEAIGRCCPQLKTLKFNGQGYRHPHIGYDDDDGDAYDNDEAFAIAKYMPGLHHLQLIGNEMTNDGLVALLDGCPHLESLDIRRCFNVNLVGTLGKRCKEQIKYFRLPHDATDDYPFQTSERDCESPVEDDADESDMLSDYEFEYEYSDDFPFGF